MDPEAAALSVVGIQGALRFLEVTLRLYDFLLPKQAKLTENSSYDYVVVGAGTAGCVLANRLSADRGVSVLLIEAGDNPTMEVMAPGLTLYNQRSKFDWNYTSVNDGHAFQCHKNGVFLTSRGHGMGGTSSTNFMLYARGDPHDYNEWAEITNDDSWNYENVLPYFKKGERIESSAILHSKYRDFHGTKGEMGIDFIADPGKLKYMDALTEVKFKQVLDTNGNYTLGFNFPMYSVSKGVRQSSCYSYLSPIKDRKNLHVLRNTKVNKVVFRRKKAIGVEITNGNTKSIIKANLEVILSAGVFNSPQILMLSGIGPKNHLKSFNIKTLVDLPVGYNLQDHTGVIVAHETDTYKNEVTQEFNPFKPSLLTINGFIALNKRQNYPDAQLEIASSTNAENFLQLLTFLLNFKDDVAQIAYEANKKREVLFAFILKLHPLSRGRVMLRSADPRDDPNIHLESFSENKDLVDVIRYVKDYLRIEQSSYFRRIKAQRIDLAGNRCKGFKKGSDEYWRCYTLCLMTSMYHYSSSCAMGSVVDSKLRVKGVEGLRVVDASVFPTIPSGNTNAPSSMVAEKAADMIKMDHCS